MLTVIVIFDKAAREQGKNFTDSGVFIGNREHFADTFSGGFDDDAIRQFCEKEGWGVEFHRVKNDEFQNFCRTFEFAAKP